MEFIVNNFPAILTVLGFAVALVIFIVKAVKGKKWGVLLSFVLQLMQEAEHQFSTGSERKEWVIGMVEAASDKIGYKMKTEDLSKLIDDLCKMSKNVNVNH